METETFLGVIFYKKTEGEPQKVYFYQFAQKGIYSSRCLEDKNKIRSSHWSDEPRTDSELITLVKEHEDE